VTAPARTPGKLGRRPRNPERPVLTFETYIRPRSAAFIPVTPETREVDRASQVSSWPMYLNDQLGDCTIAGAAHMLTAMCVYAGHPEPSFPGEVIQAAYSAVSGYVPGDESTDNGADMQTVLEYLRQDGLADATGKVHKVAGYALIGNPANEQLLGSVLEATGTVYYGIACPDSALTQFSAGEPWTYVPGPPPQDGHCIVLQRRLATGTASAVDEWVTWGQLQRGTFGFAAHYGEEAYFVASEDWVETTGADPEGLDLAQLLADMSSVS
jgi:hypothetical protein